MTEEMVFAGFGGQGVLSLGQIVAYSGMLEGKEVCWMPSYGPEMRGGTANCIVSVSDQPISSPILATFDTAIILNRPSYDKFESRVKEKGVLIYDKTNINVEPSRNDIEIIGIDASKTAKELGNMQVMGMVLLGAYLKKKNIVKKETVKEALKKVLPERHHKLIPLNIEALEKGMSLI